MASTPPNTDNLPEIIRRAQRGDRQSLKQLYALYSAALIDYCYQRCADTSAAQKCVEEIFAEVWRGIGAYSYQSDKLFRGWLYTLANARLLLVAGARPRHPWFPRPLPTRAPTAASAPVDARAALPKALGYLSIQQQDVIALRFFVGLSNTEIAAALALTEDAVKTVQSRAIHRLHALIGAPV